MKGMEKPFQRAEQAKMSYPSYELLFRMCNLVHIKRLLSVVPPVHSSVCKACVFALLRYPAGAIVSYGGETLRRYPTLVPSRAMAGK